MFKHLKCLVGRTAASPVVPPPNGGVGADIPIRRASEDLLSRTVLARRIAELLSTPGSREGRVFAIRGGWGYGKSSLKNLVIEALGAREPTTDYLEFNPWQWGDGDQIARALFSQMASQLGGTHAPDAAKRAKALRRYGGILVGGSGSLGKAADDKGLSSWLTSAALVCAAIGIGFPNLPSKLLAAGAVGLAGLAMALGKFLAWLGQDQSDAPLDTVRQDLEARLQRLERPLVIFVDDIDRLEPDQIRLLFRQIKVNANLPNIIFVLLFQPSIVEEALRPVAGSEGREYLGKIVQAHFDLPPVSPERLFQIFGTQLGELIGPLATPQNGFEQRRWGNVVLGGIQPFIRNMRDVRRILSSVEIHIPLHQGERLFEVNIIDFLALEVLRVFEADLHAAISDNKALLLQSNRFSGDRRDQDDRAAIEALVAGISATHRPACEALLKELFPPSGWVFGGSHYSDGSWVREWMKEKRICTARGFDRYFALQLPDGAISGSDFAALEDATADDVALAAEIDKLRQRGLLATLATRFDESVEELPLDNIDKLLPAIFTLGEELGRQPGADGLFNTPFVAAWRAASWYLRRLATPEERAEVMLAAMAKARALAAPAILISIDMDVRAKPEEAGERLFDDVGLERIKTQWLEIIAQRLGDTEDLLGDDHLIAHLYRWRDFSGSLDGPKAWVEDIAADPELFPKLIVRFLSVGTQSSWGDRVSTKSESFRYETMTDFFDLSMLKRQVAAFDMKRIDPEEARILGILNRYLERWESGRSSDD